MNKLFLVMLVLLMLGVGSAQALEISDVIIAEKAKISDSNELTLNGAGLRKRAFFKVYVAALYLAEKKTTAQAVLADSGPKRMAIHIRRELSAEQLLDALNDGLKANNSAAELAPLESRLKEFDSIMTSVGKVTPGNLITLDYIPGTGTKIQLNGQSKGTIVGDDFNKALLKIWLGEDPVQDSLKKALLGN
ncbi:MAG: chalcone isomerase family protein [Burkholderiales bacterium]